MVRFPKTDLPTTWLSTSIGWSTFDIGMLYRITKILSHPQSINVSYNDNTTQYNMPTSQATISNPFDMEWYASGSTLVFRFNVALNIATL